LKKHQGLLETEGLLASFENMNLLLESRNNYIKDLEEKEEQNCKQKLDDAYEWLSPADYSSDHEYFLALRGSFPGTSAWLLKRNDMIS
jgi:CRISPR/Cas system-associated protein Csm6